MTVYSVDLIRCVILTNDEMLIFLKHCPKFWKQYTLFQLSNQILDFKCDIVNGTFQYKNIYNSELSEKIIRKHIQNKMGINSISINQMDDDTFIQLFTGHSIGDIYDSISVELSLNAFPHTSKYHDKKNIGKLIKRIDVFSDSVDVFCLEDLFTEEEMEYVNKADKELLRLGFKKEHIKTIIIPDDCGCCG
jgi:hypothetical protein